MNRTLFTTFILGLLALGSLQAQNDGYWEEVPRPDGGYVSEAVATSNGKVYVKMLYGEVYRSDNNAENWVLVDSLDISYIKDYTTFYIGKAGTAFGLKSGVWYRSTNEGFSWQPLGTASFNIPPFEAQMEKFVECADGVVAGFSKGKFFYSEDHGDTWLESLASDPIPYAEPNIRLLPNGEIIVSPPFYFQSDSIYTFFRSSDSGRTWHEHLLSFPIPFNFEPSFSPSGAVFLFNQIDPILRSPGIGLPFEEVPCDSLTPIVSPYFSYSNDLTVLPSGRLVKSAARNMLYSDDDGLTWHEFPDYPYKNDWSFGITFLLPDAVLPNDKPLMSRGFSGLYASNDLGNTWNFASKNIRSGLVLELDFETDSSFYAVTPNGVWSTQNKGINWKQLNAPLRFLYQATEGGTPYSFLHLDKPNTLLMGAFDTLYFSTNGGETFKNLKPAILNNPSYEFWSPNINPTTKDLYINNFRSLDSGATWQYSNHPSNFLKAPSGALLGLIFDSGTIQVSKSEDEGATWFIQNSIPGIIWASRLKIAPDGTLYSIGGTYANEPVYLLKSENGGETWTRHTLPYPNNLNVLAPFHLLEISNLGHLVLSIAAKTYLSINKGASWQSIPDLPIDFYGGYGQLSTLSISPDQYLYESQGETGLFKTRKPIDKGAYLQGKVQLDSDADCSTDDATAPLKNWVVEASGVDQLTYTTTDILGEYVMLLDTGVYQVGLKLANEIWWGNCDSLKTFQASALFETDTLNFSAVALSECPLMAIDVALPTIRRCFNNTVFIQYCNIGSEPADSAWADLMLDPYLSLQSCPLPYTALGNNTFRIALGDVLQGDCATFNLQVYANCDSTIIGQTHCISVHGFPDTLCTALPNWSGANLEAEANCQDSTIELILRNTGTATSQLLDYVIIEDDVVLMTSQESYDPAEALTLNFPANGHTWRIESEQEPGHPFSNQAIAFAEGCGGFESLGFINQFSVNGFRPSIDQECLENTGSYDPNDKQGFPKGIGEEHEIRPGQELEYKIRFQNTGTDTAFTVLIRDTLSALLDPASVRPGAASHAYTWELKGSGVLELRFDAIALPDSNINLIGSQGFVTFRANQKEALPLGSVIYNQAGIYFDFNDPVMTNQTWHTVDLPKLSSNSPAIPDNKYSVEIAPNPATNFIGLKSRSTSIQKVEISNADGSFNRAFEFGAPALQAKVELGLLPNGTYFARVFCEDGVVVQKFVISRG